jgi:hypothetical protein
MPPAIRSPLQPLASGFRDKMARQLAMRQAARPDVGAAPVAPSPGAPPDTTPAAYRKGGKVKSFGFAKGGAAKGTMDYSK